MNQSEYLELTIGLSHVGVKDNFDKDNFWRRGEGESLIGGDGGNMDGEFIHQLWALYKLQNLKFLIHSSLPSLLP